MEEHKNDRKLLDEKDIALQTNQNAIKELTSELETKDEIIRKMAKQIE